MADSMQDTSCAHCYYWLARLSPGGCGILFCNEHCAWRYDQENRTSYAFDRYHYIPQGSSVTFKTLNQEHAWASLIHWCSKTCYPKTIEQVKEQYNLTHIGADFIAFTKMKW